MSGLKDLFEENPDGTYKSHLGSVGERLLEEKNEEYNEEHQEQEEQDGGDPDGNLGRNDMGMMDQPNGNMPSERFLDRMIRIRGIRKPSPNEKSTMMWNDPEFLEQLVINSFDKEMSRKIYRSYLDISDLSEGDGNAELVRSHAVGLALKTIMQRSRNDFPDIPNERGQWGENRQVHKNINVNRGGGGRATGFFQRLFGK